MLSQRARSLILIAACPLLTGLALAGEMAPPTEAEIQSLMGERWYGVYIGGTKCGYAEEAVKRTELNGQTVFAVSAEILMKIQVMDTQQEMTLSDRRFFSEDGRLIGFESGLTTVAGSQLSTATVTGDKMRIVSQVAGQQSVQEVPAPTMTFGDLLGVNLLAMRKAEVGSSSEMKLYEPTIGKEVRAVTTIGETKKIMFNGVETTVVKVSTDLPGLGMTSNSWVSTSGLGLETEQQMGSFKMVLKLENEELARDITYSHDLLNASTIKVDKPITNPTKVRTLTLRLSGLDNDEIVIPSRRMRYEEQDDGDYMLKCMIERADPRSARKLPIDDPGVKEYLAAEELVQSDAPEIVNTAKQIVGGETNSWLAARRINTWVYDNLEKVGTASLSNALDTLRSRSGDCSEHSVLAVALCRAAGIPARQSSGLVYWEQGRGFVGHQWTEVWTGQWVAMDPAFGQDVADATHLKFAEGTLRDAISVYAFFSALKIQVISFN